MVSFIFYDLVFMVLFGILAILFFNKNKKNVKRHGWIFLYHSKVGIRWMDAVVDRFDKFLKPLRYLVVGVGYILMVWMVWIMGFAAYIYITSPIPKQLQGLPPIAPLIPYFPKLFGMESFFPPLYFTYFLIALAIVAVSHEFAHGIFARLHKIKIKTTGLAFFGPFFGAFVEPDEKQMQKAKKFPQLSILAAGVFANVLMTIIFVLLLWGFFAYSFEPAGVNYVYPQAIAGIAGISSINGNQINNFSQIIEFSEEGLNKITIEEYELLVYQTDLKQTLEENLNGTRVFYDAPAINAHLQGAIFEINNVEIRTEEKLVSVIESHSPGEIIEIKTIRDGEIATYNIELANMGGKAFLGISMGYGPPKGAMGFFIGLYHKYIKNPQIEYSPTWDGDFVQFIYDLLWWIVVINILVALFNMLPVAMLDGGRFFYLTVLGITGSEKIGKKAFAYATWAILAMLLAMMFKWTYVNFLN